MATRIVLTDDIDGSEGAETLAFAIDGRGYEIDLAAKNRAAFEKALTKYVDNARRVGSRVGSSSSRRRPTSTDAKERRRQIREWATAQGYEVPVRGRLSAALIEAYEAEH